MEAITFTLPRTERADGSAVVSTRIDTAGRAFDVWYRVSDGPVADGVETFLAAVVVPAMRLGLPIRPPAPISARFLGGIVAFQKRLRSWFPALRPVPILAEPQVRAVSPASGAASCFSGGVDACYTLLRHHAELTRTVLIHGFDYSHDQPRMREATSRLLGAAAATLGRPLLEVDTNIRTFGDHYANWGYEYHGSILASVALLLAPQFGTFYLPSSYPYADLYPWGSHPELDPHWSSDGVEIVHDGCDVTRCEKVARVAQCDEALKVLRVCWTEFKKGASYNCGKCEKCLRTMMDLRIVGALGRCSTFTRPLRLQELALINMRVAHHRVFYAASLRHLEQSGHDPELAAALREALSERHYRGIEGRLRAMGSTLRRRAVRPLMRPLERSARWLTRPMAKA